MRKYNKMLKKLKKIIRKDTGVKDIDISLDDTISNVAERVVMKAENCSLEEAYEMYIGGISGSSLHLPGWAAISFVIEFCDLDKVTQNSTIKEMFDAAS